MQLRTALALCALLHLPAVLAQGQQEGGCLYSDTQPRKDEGCSDDPLGMARLPEIRQAIRILGLEGETIKFRGCRSARYSARARAADYVVTYEIPTEGARDTALAPLFHELAHVYQYRRYGGYARLSETMAMKKIELSADFLTGLLFQRFLNRFEMAHFQQNMRLIGRYLDSPDNTHGTPGQRTNAFRSGVYFRSGNGVADALSEFERNRYGLLMQSR